MWTEAVSPAVVSVKTGMGLENEVHLPGEPEPRVLQVREHARIGIRIALRCRVLRRVLRVCGKGEAAYERGAPKHGDAAPPARFRVEESQELFQSYSNPGESRRSGQPKKWDRPAGLS